MMFEKFMIMNEVTPDASGSALGGTATPEAPTPEAPVEGQPTESIWGDLQVKFPEGIEPDVKESNFLKPFVNKENGEVNMANLMKSYVHAQKNMNSSKVVLPSENATDAELDEFYSKLGYVPDENEYTVEAKEGGFFKDEALKEVKDFARKHRMKPETAQELLNYMEEKNENMINHIAETESRQIEEGLEGLKGEWGQAYDSKIGNIKRLLSDVVKDEKLIEAFADPRIGSNPGVLKALSIVSEGLFKEDGVTGSSNNNMFSPAEASAKINELMANPAYWDKAHPQHGDLVRQVTKLHEMKRGR